MSEPTGSQLFNEWEAIDCNNSETVPELSSFQLFLIPAYRWQQNSERFSAVSVNADRGISQCFLQQAYVDGRGYRLSVRPFGFDWPAIQLIIRAPAHSAFLHHLAPNAEYQLHSSSLTISLEGRQISGLY